jgi:hypothetical protein
MSATTREISAIPCRSIFFAGWTRFGLRVFPDRGIDPKMVGEAPIGSSTWA